MKRRLRELFVDAHEEPQQRLVNELDEIGRRKKEDIRFANCVNSCRLLNNQKQKISFTAARC